VLGRGVESADSAQSDLRVRACRDPGMVAVPHLHVSLGVPRRASDVTRVGLVVFDLAGTTIKDPDHVASAFVAALAEQEIQVSEGDLSGVRGASKRQAIARFIPDGPERARRAEAAYAAFREHLANAYRANGVHAIAGADAVFRDLRARAVRVALNTGFERDLAELLLQGLRWDTGVVDAVICGDDVSEGRPAPFMIFRAMERTNVHSVHEVANVGDTDLDLRAGANAGVRWNVGVLTGAHDRQRLSSAPHTHLLDSIADLPALWPEIQGR
jgi:phosphonatase-like hydrolase